MKVIILAGGKGSRLWPLCKEECPKQFASIFPNDNGYTLFQSTLVGALKLTSKDNIFVVTNINYKSIATKQANALCGDFPQENIICETVGKNTLPAILYGVKVACKAEPSNVVVFPSDHKINKQDEMLRVIKETESLALNNIVTFGMTPDNPSVEYGYIEQGEKLLNGFKVKNFKEKPCRELAKEFLKLGYLWNSGIFMFNSALFMSEAQKYSPDIYKAITESTDIEACYANIAEGNSIDFGIMEKTDCAAVVPMNVGWSDLGGFDAIYSQLEGDASNNVCRTDLLALDSKNNLVISQNAEKVVLLGVEDIIAVEYNGILVLCKRNESYRIKDAVEQIKKDNPALL